MPFHGFPFVSVQDDGPGFICCKNLGLECLSVSFKPCQQLERNCFSVGFVLDCEAWMIPRRAHLRISNISLGVTGTSFADRNTECQLSGCDESILANSVFSTLSAVTGESYSSPLLLQKPSLVSPSHRRSFYRPQHFTNIAKTFVDVSYWLIPGNNQFYRSTLLVPHVID